MGLKERIERLEQRSGIQREEIIFECICLPKGYGQKGHEDTKYERVFKSEQKGDPGGITLRHYELVERKTDTEEEHDE